jgi:hypothetical protein
MKGEIGLGRNLRQWNAICALMMMMMHSNERGIGLGRNLRQWNIMCVDDDAYTP